MSADRNLCPLNGCPARQIDEVCEACLASVSPCIADCPEDDATLRRLLDKYGLDTMLLSLAALRDRLNQQAWESSPDNPMNAERDPE